MVADEVIQKGNLLSLKLSITTNKNTTCTTKKKPEFVISGAVLFQMRLTTWLTSNGYNTVYNCLVFVQFTKQCDTDDLTYMIHFSSKGLNIVNKTFTSDDGTWHLIHKHEDERQQFTFDVAVEMHPQPSTRSFASLHGDTGLTDFELRGEDGSVRMHRAVLAVASPELRRLLGGEWRETAEGYITGTSKTTIEHFKDYVYLHELPKSGLEQLLLLSSFFTMPELEHLCVNRLVRDMNAESACDLINFAAENNAKRLLLAVLECVQNGAISVADIRKHLR